MGPKKEAIGKILSAGHSLPTSALNYLYVMLSFMYITYFSHTHKKIEMKIMKQKDGSHKLVICVTYSLFTNIHVLPNPDQKPFKPPV